jgi:hypothetical protein
MDSAAGSVVAANASHFRENAFHVAQYEVGQSHAYLI